MLSECKYCGCSDYSDEIGWGVDGEELPVLGEFNSMSGRYDGRCIYHYRFCGSCDRRFWSTKLSRPFLIEEDDSFRSCPSCGTSVIDVDDWDVEFDGRYFSVIFGGDCVFLW
jgi:hypothetical protein